ncbi:AAA family ATPase [Nocardioides sp. cx-169]|uniref:AAA family ATPase n=1 Tax=Nocardioides sp. cx-169 TaxID=2899080 RepID=UPI001E33F245|nr:AAA family ATPase [Nocardioides sp. cx-169]MCD4534649.1 AAA family ATPase [Nocardioides sp. cx-169]
MDFNQPPVRRVEVDPGHDLESRAWPMTLPVVRQLAREGLELARGVTFLVGENGSGKSTVVEAVAAAYGLSPEGGSTHSRHSTRESESPLHRALAVRRGIGASRWGFFLRAETMHGWYTYIENLGGDVPFHELSHGESFLAVLESRFGSDGFYCLDEPEAALSFSSTLALVAVLHRVTAAGGQVLCATHSPVLAAMPGARILEVGEWGFRETAWEDLQVVDHWRRFLERPDAYLRHLVDDEVPR